MDEQLALTFIKNSLVRTHSDTQLNKYNKLWDLMKYMLIYTYDLPDIIVFTKKKKENTHDLSSRNVFYCVKNV